MIKKVATYIIIIGAFVLLIGFILEAGNKIVRTNKIELVRKTDNSTFTDKAKPVVINSDESVFRQLTNNIKYPISILMLQVIIILFASKLFGIAMKMFGQQTVVGEIIAGIFLGPSILGWLFPDLSALIFPRESLISLQFLSQIGLAFFMFVIGMELDISKIKNKTQDAVIISHASIIFPFFLGACLSYFIFLDLAPQNVSFVSFTLFLGIAMSITAFPVLARILKERGLTRTPLGVLTITCAAADDVTAWCLLAAVIAIVKAGSIVSALFTIGLTVVYLVLMFIVLKPWLQKSSEKHMIGESIDKTTIAISFFVLLLSAYFTEIIGIHALFGAFIAGVIMPDNVRFKTILIDKIEDVSTILLLPIFFAFTGLRTQIGLINTGYLWSLCGLIILVAITGKFGGSTLTAKIVGRSWKDSLSIGALMNTRGLMELVVLNIGYDLGVLGPEIFSIMVLMALCTTFLTGPLLDLINFIFKK
ncbi:MAG: cation:proton antiporter [Prolixibacteraceae bacterium]|jgi:Kef-type K+ transport system membrane component KefB|nr:cation:proton antiporter [Prolixibacteraceae bacterium]